MSKTNGAAVPVPSNAVTLPPSSTTITPDPLGKDVIAAIGVGTLIAAPTSLPLWSENRRTFEVTEDVAINNSAAASSTARADAPGMVAKADNPAGGRRYLIHLSRDIEDEDVVIGQTTACNERAPDRGDDVCGAFVPAAAGHDEDVTRRNGNEEVQAVDGWQNGDRIRPAAAKRARRLAKNSERADLAILRGKPACVAGLVEEHIRGDRTPDILSHRAMGSSYSSRNVWDLA